MRSFKIQNSIYGVRSLLISKRYSRRTTLFCQTPQAELSTEATPTKPPSVQPAKVTDLELLEIRVGKITEISKHPEADSLYIETVDVGEASPRTIVSGLVKYCSLESLLNRKVVVLCNLKPRPFKGIMSHGMLLCVSNEDHTKVDPLCPPENCPVGELITFDGYKINPAEPGNKATKAYTKIAEEFFVNENSLASYKNIPFMTSAGPIIASMKGKIS